MTSRRPGRGSHRHGDHDRDHAGRDRRGPGLGLECQAHGRVLRLGQHDREEQQDADGADVDQHLRGGDEGIAEQHVDAGQRGERGSQCEPAADDVPQGHDQQRGSDQDGGEHDEEHVVPPDPRHGDRVGYRHASVRSSSWRAGAPVRVS